MSTQTTYYVPHKSYWPFFLSIALFSMLFGFVHFLHGRISWAWFSFMGIGLFWLIITAWFVTIIRESLKGKYHEIEDRSFHQGMVWFIFSEVCFFGALFGAYFYVRLVIMPDLSAQDSFSHTLLWPNFKDVWPSLIPPNPDLFTPIKTGMTAWGVATINTILLVSSGFTIVWAHRGLLKNNRKQLIWGLIFTIALGVTFLGLQAYEYTDAYLHKDMTLHSGIYGTTFFMLTGFHGLHVTIGTIMLLAILLRCFLGHFTPAHHFAFKGVSWYWHFVDIVWILLFILVY